MWSTRKRLDQSRVGVGSKGPTHKPGKASIVTESRYSLPKNNFPRILLKKLRGNKRRLGNDRKEEGAGRPRRRGQNYRRSGCSLKKTTAQRTVLECLVQGFRGEKRGWDADRSDSRLWLIQKRDQKSRDKANLTAATIAGRTGRNRATSL